MKINTPSCPKNVPRAISFFAKLARLVLPAVALTCAQVNSRAQIQTAGTVFINVDATALSAGALSGNDIANSGSLGGMFESTNTTFVAPVSNVNALVLSGTNYLRLMANHAGALIPPPSGLVGTNATCSIEVWALNPQVAGDECMISWGARSAGQNMGFEYGNGTSGGAQHNAADIVWDQFDGGAPLNNYWHHLVYTYDGSNQNLYADGVLANSQPVVFATATNQGIALGAQWQTIATNFPNISAPALATLAIARIRVHDGTLTAAQVLNNYNFEKSVFLPAAVTPAFLTAGPVHRYSFNEAPTNDATGLTFLDSVGGANGTVQGSEINSVAAFSGRRLVLKGGIQTTQPGFGAPYADLPNGLVSANSTNNGGSGELSIEIWWRNYGGVQPGTLSGNGPWSWSRVFDIGSCGTTSGGAAQVGVEVTGPGSYPASSGQLDYFIYSAQVGQGYAAVNQRQLGWQNKDIGPAGSTTNISAVTANVQTMGTYLTDRHVVVTWKESTGLVNAYENGVQVASIVVSNAMSALNDINVWLGRSQSGSDHGFAGEYDEVRFYNYALSQSQAVGDFLVGPNTVNTAVQAVTISTQPQSVTANQGWPASFYITASGSPAASYQWSRNGTAIPGATTDTYSISAVTLANNADSYSCVVSNFANSTPNVVTSSAATLSVLPNVSPVASILHETKESNPTAAIGSQRDNYSGVVGAAFTAGSGGALVTHLGFYDYNNDGFNRAHNVGLFTASDNAMVASVSVPAGLDPSTFLTNGYRYVALTNPVMLTPNAVYIIEGEAFNGDGDMWADAWVPGQWNSYFIGTNGFTSRAGRFGGPWPAAATSLSTGNGTYGAPNLGAFPVGPAQVWAAQTSVTQYVGIPVTLTVLANGQAPTALQWYKAPSTLLAGQTGPSLTFNNPALSDAGNYYAIVSNSLGTNQSANITLTILGNTPVTITQQPTNLTVPQLFPASFTIAASGTPPIAYQWSRNGSAIAGATTTIYSIAAASMTNNGDVYTCLVSNRTTVPNTVTSASATLTVQPNQAPPSQMLFPPIVGLRDDFSGMVGGIFQIGASPAKVTHLGFYSTNGTLNFPHHVGIFPAIGGAVPIASVFVNDPSPPVPQTPLLTNSYLWIALTNPITLAANTSYILAAEVFANDGDLWPDQFVPAWNPYYVGASPATTRTSRYTGSGWPNSPSTVNVANSIYAPGNLAILPSGPPVIVLDQTNITQYTGSNVTITAFVDGDVPLSVQWYKGPGTLLTGQTNSSLNFPSAAIGDSGTYYLIANNGSGSAQSSNVTLSIIAAGPPPITQQPQSQTVYSNQTVYLSVSSSVTPSGYQWTFNGTPISGATNSSLVLPATTTAFSGNYRVSLSNSFGTTNSAIAVLAVLNPAAGSYLASVLGASPLVYYRFSDVTNGGGATYNYGTLGAAETGTLEGSYTDAPGPQPPTFANFESNNDSLALDGSTVDASIPPLNLSGGPNVTLAAWINPNGVQSGNAGIIFSRGSVASGLGIKHDGNNPGVDMLEYHWNSLYFQSNSFLDLPTNQWSFVALTIAPTQAIIYLQDGTSMKTWTNNSTHASVAFDSNVYVGWDNIDLTTRRFNGAIDEPMIFGRTLSVAEVNNLYQAATTLTPVLLKITAGTGANVILTWPSGTLQQAPIVTGPYTNVPSATSPYTNATTGAAFYRVLVQ